MMVKVPKIGTKVKNDLLYKSIGFAFIDDISILFAVIKIYTVALI